MNTYHVSVTSDRFGHKLFSVHRNNAGIVLGEGNVMYHQSQDAADKLMASCIKTDTFHDACDLSQKTIRPGSFPTFEAYLEEHRAIVTRYMREMGYTDWIWSE